MGEATGPITVPPHDLVAEDAVIGALLLDNAAWDGVGDMLAPADFYAAANRAVFSTIGSLVKAGKPADVISVHLAGGHDLPALNAAAQSIPSARHARHYAEVVRELSLRRQLMVLARDLACDAQQCGDGAKPLTELLDAAAVALLDMQQGRVQAQEPRLMGGLMMSWIDALQERASGKCDAMPTGLLDVDKVLGGGLRPGEVVVLAARPSMGKSALAQTIARNMAQRVVVALLSMEDSEQMLISRSVAAAGRVNLADLRRPEQAPDRMWSGVADAVETLGTLRLYIDDAPALSLQQVRTKAQQVRRRAGSLGVLMLDYIQLMEDEGETRAQELTRVARGLKRLAKELGMAVVVLSQLSREADKVNGPPRLDHLAESGGIEQAADIIGLLWRKARRDKNADKHEAQIEFAKNKNGATDTVQLYFDGATQRFADAVREHAYDD